MFTFFLHYKQIIHKALYAIQEINYSMWYRFYAENIVIENIRIY
jgi:hypothetical protein